MKTIEKPLIIITTTLFILLVTIVFILMMTGCVNERIEGNHDVITTERSSQAFTEVASQGSFSVKIIPSTETRIVITGESNVLPYLTTNLNGTTLTLGYRENYAIHEHYPVEIVLYTPQLNSIGLSGSGSVESGSYSAGNVYLNISGSGNITGDFDSDKLEAVISGSGNMEITGTAGTGKLNISGSGNINTQNMLMDYCSATISGSGNITVHATKTLDATISGSGSIFYLGNPAITTHISGSGNLVRY